MVWVERDLCDHLVPTPCYRQGHLPLGQGAQNPIQPALACFKEGGIHNLTGQPVSVSHHPHSKEFLPNIYCKSSLDLRNHRIITWFWLEGTLRITWLQPPCYRQGHLPLDQVAYSPIQPGLECFQGGGIHKVTGQPVPVSHYTHSKEFLSNI